VEFRRLLDSGDVRFRADLARRSGLSAMRVTQILALLRLAPPIIEYIRALPAGPRERMVTELSLRHLTCMKHGAQLDEAGMVWTMGFVTAEGAERLAMPGFVAVYLPQAYNFAGNLIIVPANRVQPVLAEAPEIMAFIVSGGVSGSAEPKRKK
jgi:hypothetical protein